MAPLVVLLVTYAALTVLGRVVPTLRTTPGRRGTIAMAALFVFTGAGHFFLAEGMTRLLPPWVPERRTLIYASGFLELAIAVGLLIPRFSRPVAVAGIVMLIAFLPANVWAAIQRVDFGGHAAGPVYLLFRVPLQAFFIGWLWWFSVRVRPIKPVLSSTSPAGTRGR